MDRVTVHSNNATCSHAAKHWEIEWRQQVGDTEPLLWSEGFCESAITEVSQVKAANLETFESRPGVAAAGGEPAGARDNAAPPDGGVQREPAADAAVAAAAAGRLRIAARAHHPRAVRARVRGALHAAAGEAAQPRRARPRLPRRPCPRPRPPAPRPRAPVREPSIITCFLFPYCLPCCSTSSLGGLGRWRCI